jgi:mono/diheme cytochrome c family protein
MRTTKITKLILGIAAALAVPMLASAQQSEAHIGKLSGHTGAGKQLYFRYCWGCHGVRGDGNGENAPYLNILPRNFVAATFKCRSTPTGTLPTDEDLFNSMTRGFNNSYMPSWIALTNQQRADLVAFIKTLSPRWKSDKAGTPISIPPEPALTVDSIKHGSELFQKMECWKCHGQEGRGDGPSAATLTDSNDQPIRPYNFAEGSRFKCGTSNQDLYKVFMTGLDGTPMPSFADNLKPEEAWDLVHYLRTLQINYNRPELALWRSTKQPGLEPINALAATGGASAPPAPGVSSPPAQGASAPTAGEAAKAREGAATAAPAQPAAKPQPGTTPASGPAETSAANPAPAQPGAEPQPGTITPSGGAERGTANPVPVQPTVSQPAGVSKPPGAAGAISGGMESARSAVNPPADPRSTGPRSELSHPSATVHTEHPMPTLGKLPRVELLNVAVADKAGRISVIMTLSGPVVPQLMWLDSPARVVVDLPKTLLATPQQSIAVGKNGAKGVRLGMDSQVPPTTRVVVDLTQPLAYRIVPGGENTWILELYPKNK